MVDKPVITDPTDMDKYVDTTPETTLRMLDACAGSGMLGEGLKAAVPGSEVVGFIERQAHSAAVLLERMESKTLPCAPIWCGDLQDFDASAYRGAVDCVVAGFPCQPWSLAGSRKGTEDERWILPDILDLAVEAEAPLIALENNRGLDIASVIAELDERGYMVAWTGLEAADVGASHHRFRWFFLAYSDRYGQRSQRVRGILNRIRQTRGHDPDRCGGEERTDADSDEIRAQQKPIRWRSDPSQPTDDNRKRTHSNCSRQRSKERDVRKGQRNTTRGLAERSDTEVQRRVERSVSERNEPAQPDAQSNCNERADARSARQQGCRSAERARPKLTESDSHHERLFAWGPRDPRSWRQPTETQPAVGELVHGLAEVVDIAHRKQQLWLIGNGVVPLQAAVAYRVLAYRLAGHLERQDAQ